MKQITYITAIIIFALSNSACKHNDIFTPVEFNVSTDPSNTFLVGEPVKFNFTGNVDNIVAYDGTAGHEYINKNIYTYPIETIESCILTVGISKRSGSRPQSLKAYISNNFEGLNGPGNASVEAADTLLLQTSIIEGAGVWIDIELENPNNNTYVYKEIDITDYKENFCLGFEWKTIDETDIASGQTAYWIQTSIEVGFNNGNPPMTIYAKQMRFNSIRLEDIAAGERYLLGNVPGLSRYDTGGNDILFVGAGNDELLPYAVNTWAISSPSALNPREADKGEVIKSFKDDLDSHSITFRTAGTYMVTFVAGTTNYVGSGSVVREVEVIITDPVV